MAIMNGSEDTNIIDIRRQHTEISVHDELLQQLRAPEGVEKTMPTLLLYDEIGLKLFEEITYLDEYYLTNAEIDALNNHSDTIAERVLSGTQLVELGSGYKPLDEFLSGQRLFVSPITY